MDTRLALPPFVNEDAEEIIKRALEDSDVDEVQGWPGTDFDMKSDAGKALLGRFDLHNFLYTMLTNSRLAKRPWCRLLLLQHHRQLGSAKSINKVKVVTCEDDGGDPCLIFYVGTVLTDPKKRRSWLWWSL